MRRTRGPVAPPGGSSSGSAAALAAGLLTVATGGRHVRFDSQPGDLLRRRRHEADLRPCEPPRHRRHLLVARSRWTDDAHRRRQRDAVEGDRGTRRRGRHVRAAAGAGLHARGCGGGRARHARRQSRNRRVRRLPRGCDARVHDALDVFRKLGANVSRSICPRPQRWWTMCSRSCASPEAASYHEPFLATKSGRYGLTSVRRDVEAGSLVTRCSTCARRRSREVHQQLSDIFTGLDVFLTPGHAGAGGEPVDVRQPFRRCSTPAASRRWFCRWILHLTGGVAARSANRREAVRRGDESTRGAGVRVSDEWHSRPAAAE